MIKRVGNKLDPENLFRFNQQSFSSVEISFISLFFSRFIFLLLQLLLAVEAKISIFYPYILSNKWSKSGKNVRIYLLYNKTNKKNTWK